MILVDTSVWVDHLNARDYRMTELLMGCKVLVHPFVTGELAMGNLSNRESVLDLLQNLPQAAVANETEVLQFIQDKSLFGLGIGYIDVHLLAAAMLTPGSMLWTRDKRLLAASIRLGIAANVMH